MSNSENRRNVGGNEHDPRGQISRSEQGWQEHLARAEHEAGRFLGFYTALLRERSIRRHFDANDDDRLDTCALAMGWRLSSDAENQNHADIDGDDANETDDFDDDSPSPSPSLYSLHNLPECIAISALFRFAKAHYAQLWESHGNATSAAVAATLAGTLADAQRDMMLAVDAEEAMEYGLAICLMKKAHATLNRHFAALKSFPAFPQEKNRANRLEELRTSLMDLRDICLRIIRAAREELARHPD